MSSSYPEFVANEILDELKISGPRDLLLLNQIAYSRGAIVRLDDLRGAEARLTYVRGRSIITISTSVYNPERKRFGLCHELGHLEMHRDLFVCTDKDICEQDQALKSSQERQANQFASAFLLPARFVGEDFRQNLPSFDLIKEIANLYQVSLTATALRMTEFSREPIAVVYSQGARIRWFKSTEDFRKLEIFVDVRGPVNTRSSAGRLFDGKEVRHGWREVPAEYWLRDGEYKHDATIKESSLHMPNFDAVLTLLWVDEIIEKDELIN